MGMGRGGNMGRKGQFDIPILGFIIVLIILLILSPILYKVFTSVINPFQAQIGNMSAEAGASVGAISTTFTNFWDFMIVFVFVLNVILILLAAFLIDVHPVFFALYLLAGFFIFMLAPSLTTMLDAIHAQYGAEMAILNYTSFIASHFWIIVLGIYVISAIIMYAKLRTGGGRSFGP